MWSWIPSLVIIVAAGLAGLTWLHKRETERRYPPVGEMVALGEGRVHVLRRGTGAPVVLLHGASSNLRGWTVSLFDAVAARHQAVAIDRPGHGWSERRSDDGHDPRVQARILHGALQELGVVRPVLVGHSWAGTVALAYALAYPENTGGILFLAGVSHPWPGGVGVQHEIAATPLLGPLFAWTLVTPAYLLYADTAIARVFGPDAAPANYREKAATALYSRPANFIANAHDLTRLKPIVTAMAPRYGEIRAPLIVLTGDTDDVIFTHLHSPPLAEKAPNGELRVLKGIGHMPHHAAPDAVLTAIDDLVARRGGE